MSKTDTATNKIPAFLEDDDTRQISAAPKPAKPSSTAKEDPQTIESVVDTPEPPKRELALEAASDIISGSRQEEYGDAQESFEDIATVWSMIIGVEISPKQVAAMMVGLKLVRLSNNLGHADSWVDVIGYAALGTEISDHEVD